MITHPILLLLLLGHVIGDFYLQWKTMAENKDTKCMWLFMHCLIYSLCMATILFFGIRLSWYWLFLVLALCISHAAIDWASRYITCKKFIVKQILHFAVIIILWHIWGGCLSIREYEYLRQFLSGYEQSPASLLLGIVGLLCIVKPVGELIDKNEIWDFNKGGNTSTPDDNNKDTGRMVGYLERILVFSLLINGEFAAIAFVLTAKSVARSLEIGRSKNPTSLSEYYIIGTLLSMTSVFIIAFALGLI